MNLSHAMAADGEAEQNALLRGLIASVVAGSGTELTQGAGGTESVAQLIAAAMTQLGQNFVSLQEASERQEECEESQETVVAEREQTAPMHSEDISFNPEVTRFGEESPVGGASSQVDEKATPSGKQKQICLKLPIETRKRIISMRKEGRKCKEIAKELKVSVSGAQKVWERFLATGKVHDRKPSEYAGRPRKPVAFQQGSGFESPVAMTTHVHVGDTVDVSQNDDIHSIEYTTVSGGIDDPPAAEEAVVISGDSEIYVGGLLDMPGATVEIVETEPVPISTPSQRKQPVKKRSEYREQLLLRLIEGCPLAVLREDTATDSLSNSHVLNLSASINRPLYMESVLGHPFGRVPISQPFEADSKEAEVILSDPANPVGKDLIAALGYSTKVYFNACCKPSHLFDPNKVCTSLPFCIEPSYLADTMQKVLQLLLDLSKDPLASLERLPDGDGPLLSVKSSDGQVLTRKFPAPRKLSDYWTNLYKYGSLLDCCENFLSASIPSAPCLLCHPFEELAQTLEIKDQEETEFFPSSLPLRLSSSSESSVGPVHSHTVDSLTHHIEVQVLESGQVAMSSASVTFDSKAESTPVVAKDSLSSLQDTQAPPIITSIPSRRSLSSGSKRRRSNGNNGLSKAVHDDQVEVDGQFDMPIPDSSTSGVATTGSNTVMTFVMTSEGLSQTVPPGEEDQGESGGIDTSAQQHDVSCGWTQSQAPGLSATKSRKVSIDAATQTTSGKLRSEVQDRTPLIIRRSRGAGKTQKLTSPSAKQQPPTASTEETDLIKSAELSTGNVNETGTAAHLEVQVQTQSSPEVETAQVGIQVSETHPSNERECQSPSTTRRRSTRKSGQKVSQGGEVVEAKSSSPVRRLSPRKSPIQSSNDSPQVTPKIRTRAVAKRSAVLEKQSDVPLAKRTRRATSAVLQKANSDKDMNHPQRWGVEEVAEYIGTFQSDCTEIFKEHEVDGESLFSLDPEMMVKLMNLKTGPALKIHRKINALKKQYGTLPSAS